MVPAGFSGYTWAGWKPQFMLDRCLDCNASLKKEETECFACGAAVKSQRSGSSFGQRFATVLKYGFIGSAVLTVASLFFDATPSFGKCITATLVLLLAKSSADQMLERKSG
ncbi:MAG: hypothetical protein ABSB35_39565 [Bryobacteraceae bacterium]|jgi:hypothetical protein